MARNHIQVMIREDDLRDNPKIDWMDQGSFLKAFRDDVDEVMVLTQRPVPERGVYVLLCEHPDYPEVEDYEEAPLYKIDAPEVVPSGA